MAQQTGNIRSTRLALGIILLVAGAFLAVLIWVIVQQPAEDESHPHDDIPERDRLIWAEKERFPMPVMDQPRDEPIQRWSRVGDTWHSGDVVTVEWYANPDRVVRMIVIHFGFAQPPVDHPASSVENPMYSYISPHPPEFDGTPLALDSDLTVWIAPFSDAALQRYEPDDDVAFTLDDPGVLRAQWALDVIAEVREDLH